MSAVRLIVAVTGMLVAAMPALAQVLTGTSRGVVVAHDGRIELVDGWNVAGVENATAIAAGERRVAVLDALRNEAAIVDLATGETTRLRTAETPVAAVFLRDELYVLARDARLLQHVGGADTRLDADPAFLAAANDRLYVYSRTAGTVQEIGGKRFPIAPFASDLEIAGRTAYLAYPREGKIRTLDLSSGAVGELAVGAVPVDLAFAGGGTAITARILAVADPSAKRVWMAESTQSTTKAFARGFLRGLLGLGLFGARDPEFPTGVDRVETRGRQRIAYDSSSRTLYRFTPRGKSAIVARNVAPGAFALTGDGVAWWDGTSVAQTPLR